MYTIDFKSPIHVYFMGIGGISMSGLAKILIEEGFKISGSDSKESAMTRSLEADGVKIFYGQCAENIKNSEKIDVVVYTAAVHPDNPEFIAVKEAGIPMNLTELKIDEEHFEEMAAHANSGGYLKDAFVPLTNEDIVEIYKACL